VDLGLGERVVLITGGRRGIGFAIAQSLLEEGARVAICGRDEAAGVEAAERLGSGAGAFTADVRRDDDVRHLVAAVVERFGRLDAVVNNAGRFGGGPVAELSDERLEEGTDTKIAGALRVVRHALPHLRRSDQPRIVNISGISAESVIPGAAVTAVGNSGLLALTAYLADELIDEGITVNAVVPGYILTEVWRERAEAFAAAESLPLDEALQAILDRQRMRGRWGTAREVGEVVAFLLSRQAGFVSGATLRVDGGQFAAVTY
jgi:NAD(P)-dependent dehydrogenase (short-subunit alcohol dehydrogenase family)